GLQMLRRAYIRRDFKVSAVNAEWFVGHERKRELLSSGIGHAGDHQLCRQRELELRRNQQFGVGLVRVDVESLVHSAIKLEGSRLSYCDADGIDGRDADVLLLRERRGRKEQNGHHQLRERMLHGRTPWVGLFGAS